VTSLAHIFGVFLCCLSALLGREFWCAAAQFAHEFFAITQTTYRAPYVPFADNPLHYVAAASETTVIISTSVGPSHDRAFYRDIANLETLGLAEPLRIRIPMTPRSAWVINRSSDAFFATSNGWWYATLDDNGEAATTTFVKSDGSRVTYPKRIVTDPRFDLTRSHDWPMTAVPGEKPRVIEFAYLPEQTVATEVDWSGHTTSWQLPPIGAEHVGKVIAELLPDGRIALLTNHSGLSLYLLADDGRVDAVSLRGIKIEDFDGTLDPGGHIAVVVARKDTASLEFATVDPSHPDHLEWTALGKGTVVANELQIVATPDGFVAAWIGESAGRDIEAADIDRRGRWGQVVEIGRPSPRGEPFLSMQARRDELFFWWDDGEHLFNRRMPASFSGYAALEALGELLCGEEIGNRRR
jgi:hypothetical protein